MAPQSHKKADKSSGTGIKKVKGENFYRDAKKASRLKVGFKNFILSSFFY